MLFLIFFFFFFGSLPLKFPESEFIFYLIKIRNMQREQKFFDFDANQAVFSYNTAYIWLLKYIDRQLLLFYDSEFLFFDLIPIISILIFFLFLFLASFIPVIHRSTYLLSSIKTREREGERGWEGKKDE